MAKVEEALRDMVQHHAQRAAASVIADMPGQVRDMRRELRDIRKAVDQLSSDMRQLVATHSRVAAPAIVAVAEEVERVRFSPADLKHMRERLDLTQQEVAKILKVSPVTVAAWETGKSRPRQASLAQIAVVHAKSQAEVDATLKRQAVPNVSSADIKRLRKAMALTQTALGGLIGVSAAAVTAWETSKTSPSRENRRALGALSQKPRAKIDAELGRSGTAVAQTALSPEEIRSIREAAGLSQGELAKKLGVSANSVSNWETGSTSPRSESVRKLLAMGK
jgi:DNA-binding transcriptional regulator YiaG